ncbi:MAG: S-layer homology domain-containing protein [Lachnospiraceae bacterium]|nr:S-layer homology domain-containing protein [Lachnospiraceae bacterium]
MRLRLKKVMALLLAAAMAVGISGSPVYAGEAGQTEISDRSGDTELNVKSAGVVISGTNVVRGKSVIASSVQNNCGPELVVDGISNQNSQWNSANMKDWGSSTEKDEEAQTAQWLLIDRGADAQPIDIQAIKLWFNVKVWPMKYEIRTAASSSLTSGGTVDLAQFPTVLATVSRASYNGFVQNGTQPDGAAQDIANSTENSDTIAANTTPALSGEKLQRYVLVYFEKVNAQAPGNNINLREIEIFDTSVNVDVNAVLAGITAQSLTVENNRIRIAGSESTPGVSIRVKGSSQERVVDNEGRLTGRNIGERRVTLLIRAENQLDPADYAEKNLEILIPDNRAAYGTEFGLQEVSSNAKPEVIPSLQEWHGYRGEFVLTQDSKIIYNDRGGVGIEQAAAHMKEDLLEISGLDLTVSSGTAPTGPNDIYIESQTADTYEVGEEGYVMVTNEEGLHIYAPSYKGCLYGTITAEQILYQAEDKRAVPKGMIRDYPAYEVRGLMLDVARTPYRYQQLQDYVKIMLWYKMNEFHLHINDNDNTNTNTASEETHMGFHRLESESFPSLTSEVKKAGIPADLVNRDYYLNNADYQGNPHYTKEQWKEFSELCEANGMYLLTEIDLPGHSLLYNKYAKENPDHIDWLEGGIHYTGSGVNTQGGLELLDLAGSNSARALQFAQTLWNEYTEGTDPVISGDLVHIGADEYWDHGPKDSFARFAESMRQVIQGNLGEETQLRMWGAGTSMFSTAGTLFPEVDLAKHYQLDIWHSNYDNAKQRVQEGYGVVNCRDAFVYGNPGRDQRDVPNAEYLFNDWNPAIFGGNTDTLLGEPNLLGAKAVIWGDQSQEGMTEADVHQRVLRAVSIISEKTWDGTGEEDTFQNFELRASRLAEGPGTEIAMEVASKSSLVLDYDFENLSADGRTVYDTSGNGYDGTLETAGEVSEDGFLTLQGGKITTPLKTLCYPYSVAFELRISQEEGERNTRESSILSGYDGRLQVKGTADGELSADVNYFTRDLGYQIPADGTAVKIMLVGTFQGTRLYVNGELQTFLSQKENQDGLAPGAITTLFSSFPLPLEKIGEGLHGEMARLQVYNRAFSAEEAAAYCEGASERLANMVNVAQNTHAGGTSYKTGDPYDNAERRTLLAFKAIDGDAFEVMEDAAAQMDTATSERASYWKGYHNDSSLCIDLGEKRRVSQVQIQWRYGGKGRDFQILTSEDGRTFTEARAVTGNQDFLTTVSFDQPVETQFVKLQGQASNGSGYMIQEFLIYENVDKTSLAEKLLEAEAILAEKGVDQETVHSRAEQELLEAAVFGRAVRYNMQAAVSEAEAACLLLEQALESIKNEKPEPVQYSIQLPSEANGRVTASMNPASPGEKVTLTVSSAEGYELESISAAAADGAELELIREADGSYSFRMPEGDVIVSAGFAAKGGDEEPPKPKPWPFTDVEVIANHWKYESVKYVYENGIMNGISGTKLFDPDSSLTRAMFATVLHRMGGQEKVVFTDRFDDVKAGKWYSDAVIWANEKGIVTGFSDGNYGVNENINREQMAKMLYEYAKRVCKYDVSEAASLDAFTDVEKVSGWADGYMRWAVAVKMISGKPNDDGSYRLDPKGEATRAECAAMLMRFANKYK